MRTTIDTTTPRRFFQHLERRVLTTAVAAGALLACSEATSPDDGGTFFGPTVTMASGTARAYVTLDGAGRPTDIGLAFTDSALVGLPATAAEYVLTLPVQASATAFKHAVINWVPMGHPPAGVYTVPHFDFHFYTISNTERSTIRLGDSLLVAKMMRAPAPEFVPAGYVAGMAGELMGLHWRDPEAPELKGAAFTQTFIYGSYDGAFIFAEPMVAKSFLETKPVAAPITVKLPARYSASGYQATSYVVGYDVTMKEYRVALSGLVSR